MIGRVVRTSEQVSAIMRAIRSKDTKPEIAVRREARRLGYGYRLHRRELPGSPDLAFIGRRKAIFVHGCFWHQHDDPACKLSKIPRSRPEYWLPKFQRTKQRDSRVTQELKALGWSFLVIWECQTSDPKDIKRLLTSFLDSDCGVPLPPPVSHEAL